MGDLPSNFGGSIEELIRHYPTLQACCLNAFMDILKKVTTLVGPESLIWIPPAGYEPSITTTAIPRSQPDVSASSTASLASIPTQHDLVTSLHAANAVMSCMEMLLMRKDTVAELVKMGGFGAVIEVLRMGLGSPRFFMTSLVCCLDATTTHSIGNIPVVTAVSRCLGLMAASEAERTLEAVIVAMEESMDRLQRNLDSYWCEYGEQSLAKNAYVVSSSSSGASSSSSSSSSSQSASSSDASSSKAGRTSLRFHCFLDTVSRAPLQEICGQDNDDNDGLGSSKISALPADINCYSEVLREMAVIGYLSTTFSGVIQQMMMANFGASPSQRAQHDVCVAILSRPSTVQLVTRIVEDIYVPSQLEISRAKGCFPDPKKTEKVVVHPIYCLLVTAQDPIVVKDSPEDVGKKVCKIDRGTVVDAYERIFSSTSMIKYRVSDGWISHLRSLSSAEPQIEVIDVRRVETLTVGDPSVAAGGSGSVSSGIPPPPTTLPMSGTSNATASVAMNKAQLVDIEKFANISPRRGGFMSFFHFNTTIRTLLNSLARTMGPVGSVGVGMRDVSVDSDRVSDHATMYLPLFGRLFGAIWPSAATVTQGDEIKGNDGTTTIPMALGEFCRAPLISLQRMRPYWSFAILPV